MVVMFRWSAHSTYMIKSLALCHLGNKWWNNVGILRAINRNVKINLHPTESEKKLMQDAFWSTFTNLMLIKLIYFVMMMKAIENPHGAMIPDLRSKKRIASLRTRCVDRPNVIVCVLVYSCEKCLFALR